MWFGGPNPVDGAVLRRFHCRSHFSDLEVPSFWLYIYMTWSPLASFSPLGDRLGVRGGRGKEPDPQLRPSGVPPGTSIGAESLPFVGRKHDFAKSSVFSWDIVPVGQSRIRRSAPFLGGKLNYVIFVLLAPGIVRKASLVPSRGAKQEFDYPTKIRTATTTAIQQ